MWDDVVASIRICSLVRLDAAGVVLRQNSLIIFIASKIIHHQDVVTQRYVLILLGNPRIRVVGGHGILILFLPHSLEKIASSFEKQVIFFCLKLKRCQ